MRTSHELLLRLFHDPKYDKTRVTVWYTDRGAADNRSRVDGPSIKELSRSYMEIVTKVGTKFIPYHRILTILYNGAVLWELPPRRSP